VRGDTAGVGLLGLLARTQRGRLDVQPLRSGQPPGHRRWFRRFLVFTQRCAAPARDRTCATTCSAFLADALSCADNSPPANAVDRDSDATGGTDLDGNPDVTGGPDVDVGSPDGNSDTRGGPAADAKTGSIAHLNSQPSATTGVQLNQVVARAACHVQAANLNSQFLA